MSYSISVDPNEHKINNDIIIIYNLIIGISLIQDNLLLKVVALYFMALLNFVNCPYFLQLHFLLKYINRF